MGEHIEGSTGALLRFIEKGQLLTPAATVEFNSS